MKRAAGDRGRASLSWLETRYTFSFGDYYDPDWLGYGPLRVINHDVIQAGRGFGAHGHRDMEIISYVLRGAVEHRDSMGHVSVIDSDHVQIMSAGSGVRHSERNPSPAVATEMLQMWVVPEVGGTDPRYECREFKRSERRGSFHTLVSPEAADDSLVIRQDVLLAAAILEPGDRATYAIAPGRRAWLHVAAGRARVNGELFEAGDGASVESEPELLVEGVETADVLVFDLP